MNATQRPRTLLLAACILALLAPLMAVSASDSGELDDPRSAVRNYLHACRSGDYALAAT